jgi:predicted nucleic acid-binding protein
MSGGDFLDSNVLIYLMDEVDLRKYEISRAIVDDSPQDYLTISFQVVGETLNVLTRKLIPPFSEDEARSFLSITLMPIWRIFPSQELYSRALAVQSRYEYTFYDSLIIAAALEADCDRLLSEDMQHGQRIDGLTIVNPFLEA